jgi:hypothetical protein
MGDHMAIQLEFINLIVPIHVIKDKYPGGWEQCLKDHESLIGGRVWYDEYLFRDGAMNSMDIGFLVDEWKSRGFHTTKGGRKNPKMWDEVCVVQAMFGGATLPCDWIEVEGDTAYKKGTPMGQVIGCEQFQGVPYFAARP